MWRRAEWQWHAEDSVYLPPAVKAKNISFICTEGPIKERTQEATAAALHHQKKSIAMRPTVCWSCWVVGLGFGYISFSHFQYWVALKYSHPLPPPPQRHPSTLSLIPIELLSMSFSWWIAIIYVVWWFRHWSPPPSVGKFHLITRLHLHNKLLWAVLSNNCFNGLLNSSRQ